MHSGTLERAGSPRKRTLSRGVSEEESLRSIMKENESSTRRLARSDSRGDPLKRMGGSQQSEEEDLALTLPEMVELQSSYEAVVQELRSLEVERGTLWFQVDLLQDALGGAEEMLAEARREAHQAAMELDRERETKRKLEDMVLSLTQEVERLKEHRNTIPAVPVYTLVKEREESEDASARQPARSEAGTDPTEREEAAPMPTDEGDSAPPVARLDSVPLGAPRSGPPSPTETAAEGGGLLASFFRKGRGREQPPSSSLLGSSVDSETPAGSGGEEEEEGEGDGPLTKLQRMVDHTFGRQAEDNDTDSISAYEDASADTPETEARLPPGEGEGLPGDTPPGAQLDQDEEEYLRDAATDRAVGNDPKSPDSCRLS